MPVLVEERIKAITMKSFQYKGKQEEKNKEILLELQRKILAGCLEMIKKVFYAD